MLYKNKIDLASIAEVVSKNDIRASIDINKRNRFVKYIDGYFYSSPIVTNFYHQGKMLQLSKKGSRPNANLRYQCTAFGTTKYLIKFAKGDVWLCDSELPYDTKDRNGMQIGSIEEDLQFVFLALFGAGGGGSGSTMVPAKNGTGGAGGGVVFCCIELVHEAIATCNINTLPLTIGKGGLGMSGSYWGNSGGSTGYYLSEDICCVAGGGEGGRSDGVRASTHYCGCNGLPFVEVISCDNGGFGGLIYENGEWKESTTSPQYGFSTEPTQITYFGTKGGNNNGRAGGGAAGALGNGGSSNGYNQDGNNGEKTAGASGASYGVIARRGGDGGHGEIRIYY